MAILSTNGSRPGGAVQPTTRVSNSSRRTLRFTFRSVAPRSQPGKWNILYATGGLYTTMLQATGVRTDFLFERLIFMAFSYWF